MKRVTATCLPVIILALFALDGPFLARAGSVAAAGAHDYFDTLVARSDHWKSYSLRSHQQMLDYRHTAARRMDVTYDPANDSYYKRQDAAKVTIPEFSGFSELKLPMTADATTVTLTAADSLMSSALSDGRAMRIGSEIVTVVRQSGVGIKDGVVTVLRGQHGTAAAAHAAGVAAMGSVTSLLNQLRLPVATQDGYSYLLTWDAWFGPEFDFDNAGIGNYKTFLMGAPNYWLQIDTRFSEAPGPDIGMLGGRGNRGGRPWAEAYGEGVTSETPLLPQAGRFNVRPATWTRYWVLIDQRVGDHDPVTLWVADEGRDAVKIFDRLPMNVPGSIAQFILEFNTSTNDLQPGRGALVAYVRNWVALRDPLEVTGLLQRPGAGVPLPPLPGPAKPATPQGLRIIPG